MSQIVKILDLY